MRKCIWADQEVWKSLQQLTNIGLTSPLGSFGMAFPFSVDIKPCEMRVGVRLVGKSSWSSMPGTRQMLPVIGTRASHGMQSFSDPVPQHNSVLGCLLVFRAKRFWDQIKAKNGVLKRLNMCLDHSISWCSHILISLVKLQKGAQICSTSDTCSTHMSLNPIVIFQSLHYLTAEECLTLIIPFLWHLGSSIHTGVF